MIRLWELSLTQPYGISIPAKSLALVTLRRFCIKVFISPCSSPLLAAVSKELSSNCRCFRVFPEKLKHVY